MMNAQSELKENPPLEHEENSFNDERESQMDFSHLTIDQLKSRLIAMNVELDTHRHPKSFYLDIYKEMMKDEMKKEMIRDILDGDHKITNRKGKKKSCDNFMKIKRKRTEEEDTTGGEENNLRGNFKVMEPNLVAAGQYSQINNQNNLNDFYENLVYTKTEEISNSNPYLLKEKNASENDNGELKSPEVKLSPRAIKYVSISPSNESTPQIRESTKMYKDIIDAGLQGQWLGLNFNPLVRVLDNDFHHFDKPITPKDSPYNYNYNKRRKALNNNNNFTFYRVKNQNNALEYEDNLRIPATYVMGSDSAVRDASHLEKDYENNFNEQYAISSETLARHPPRSQSFNLADLNITPDLYQKNLNWCGITYNIGKYLLVLLGGSALMLGMYIFLDQPIRAINVTNIQVADIPKLKILIFLVVAIGIIFIISYLIKSNRESARRNDELIAENILEGLKKNLIKKIEDGEINPIIDQEQFIEVFCKENNYKIHYFNANLLPLVREFMNEDRDVMRLGENSFYVNGKIKTLWEIRREDNSGI